MIFLGKIFSSKAKYAVYNKEFWLKYVKIAFYCIFVTKYFGQNDPKYVILAKIPKIPKYTYHVRAQPLLALRQRVEENPKAL